VPRYGPRLTVRKARYLSRKCLTQWHLAEYSLFVMFAYPNVAYLRQEKTRKSATDGAAHRLGQVEAYFTVREVLSEASTAADGALSRERSGFYRCRYATLG
jgi:hypothetical protein